MSTIFRDALEVIVWLGPQSEHSSILMALEIKPWSTTTLNLVLATTLGLPRDQACPQNHADVRPGFNLLELPGGAVQRAN
jgi:hypothetical protein